MKHQLTIVFALFYAALLGAKCGDRGLWVYPNQQTIKQNSIFVLSGYAKSQEVITGLNVKYHVFLLGGKKPVRLNVVEICVGQFNLTQAVLKPETALDTGIQYELHIDSLSKGEYLFRYNDTAEVYEPVTFCAVAETDTEPPRISGLPKEIDRRFNAYGCGNAVYVVFSNPVINDSGIIVKTTVKNLKTGTETTYYIEPEGAIIKVGHGMCAGAFKFDDGEDYEVEFSFMDNCGNMSSMTGEGIRFSMRE